MVSIRDLKANEIDVRLGVPKDKTKDKSQIKYELGYSLLLYKDARVDMSILDETFGMENWQRKHEFKDGKLYCSVGIKFNNEWVWKEDVGTESNTEAEKGQASDSFKRACVNWGIGRELYTSPYISVTGYNKYEKFEVSYIKIVNKEITELEIVDSKGKVVFSHNCNKNTKPKFDEKEKVEKVLDQIAKSNTTTEIKPTENVQEQPKKPKKPLTEEQLKAINVEIITGNGTKTLGDLWKTDRETYEALRPVASKVVKDAMAIIDSMVGKKNG